MSLTRKTFNSREEWLDGRTEHHGIGGSEAAAAVGLSPWQSILDLWKIKTGAELPRDLSGNAYVDQGVQMEPVLRDLYRKLHPEYIIEHHPYDILYQEDRPWLFASLDGEIIERDTNRKGVLEVKTATPNGRAGWEKWNNGNMPPQYYAQCAHQLLATGFDFVRLFACLYTATNGDMTLRQYEIERDEIAEDMTCLLQGEERFMSYVRRGTMPPLPLKL